ncbi:MAG: TolC family protein [Methylovulum sp.]|nr:MAG: TolC family protein [Methylovulum sp.]
MKFALLWASLLWPAFALAVDNNVEPVLPLAQLIREALDQNPEIKAAEQRWVSAQARIPQEQTLPDPKLFFNHRELEKRETMVGVSQEIPFPGKLGLKGEIAASEAGMLEQNYLATRLTIAAALKEAYYDLHFIVKSIAIVGKNRRLLVQFEELAEAYYAVGKGAQQDVYRAQTEQSRLLARLASLEQRKQSLSADINRLLNRHPYTTLGIPEEITMTPLQHSQEQLEVLVGNSAPLLGTQVKDVERSDKTIDLAKREYLPDFELSAGGIREEPTGLNGYQVMLNVKVPLYFANKQRQGVREALAGREASKDDLQNIRQELLFRVKDNIAQAQRAEELVHILQDAIIPQARFTLAAAQASYGVGKVDFLSLLTSLLTLLDNEIELHGEIVEHEKALARLEGIIGERP